MNSDGCSLTHYQINWWDILAHHGYREPCWPTLTQWRPLGALTIHFQFFSEKSGKYWMQKENLLVWSSTHTLKQECSHSNRSQRMMHFAKRVWVKEKQHGKALVRSSLGLSQAQDEPLIASPEKTPGLNHPFAYPPLCRHLQAFSPNALKRCLSQDSVYKSFNLWAYKHFIRCIIPTTPSQHTSEVRRGSMHGGRNTSAQSGSQPTCIPFKPSLHLTVIASYWQAVIALKVNGFENKTWNQIFNHLATGTWNGGDGIMVGLDDLSVVIQP